MSTSNTPSLPTAQVRHCEPPESGQIAHTGLEPEIVIPDTIRDPVPREPWIAGRGPQ